jgi:hypothetical protein
MDQPATEVLPNLTEETAAEATSAEGDDVEGDLLVLRLRPRG